MSLKSRFFKKSWQLSNDDKRLAAVREDEDPELLSALPDLAARDPSPAVRLAALQRINSEPFWLDARLRESDPDILSHADRFLLRVVTVPDPAADEVAPEQEAQLQAARQQWLERIESTEMLRALAVDAHQVALRKQALARIHAQGFLGDCYAREPDAELAAGLLQRINQTSTLERLHHHLKKSSKHKAQAVQARLQAIRSAQGHYDAELASAERLVDQAEALARGKHLDEREAKLDELRAAWSELENVQDTLHARFAGALSIIEAAMAREVVAGASVDGAAEETPGIASPMGPIADAIRARLRHPSKAVQPQKLLAEWDRGWNSLKQVTAADEEVKADVLPFLKELQDQVQRQLEGSRKSEAEAASGAQAEPVDQAAFNDDLDQLSRLLEAGELAQANERWRTLRKTLKSIPARQRPSAVSGRLQRLEGRLKELRDYQHWSHNKQRDELIERVEALPGSGQHPDAITAALKEARAEWQRLEKLEILPGDKRKFAAPGGQWRRFQDACSAAFDLARPYFEKRQSVQEETLSELERFIESGLEKAADESAASKDLTPIMRSARQAIRRLDELPPKARGAAAGKLRELMNRISERLDRAFEKVEAEKRRLIDQAKRLGDEPELKSAIDRAKGLQADWKKAGQGRRRTDQTLWKEFRAQIDPLFERLDGERKEREQAHQAVFKEIEGLCARAEALSELDDEELMDAGNRMQEISDGIAALHPKPQGLVKRFERARTRFGDRQSEIRKKREAQATEQLQDAVLAVQAAFARRLEGQGFDSTLDKEDLAARPDFLPDALKDTLQRLEDEAMTDDRLRALSQTHLESARQVAVELEFLSGLDSPKEEQRRRMDFQVRRLADRMSQGGQKPDLGSELAELESRWFGSLPLPPDEFDAIAARVDRARSVVKQMMGIA